MVNHEYPFFNRLLPSILLIYVYPSTHARAHSLDFIFKAERVFDPSTNLSLVPFLGVIVQLQRMLCDN